MSEQAANLCTTDAAESLREIVAERDREIERLKEGQSILILARDEQKRLANEYRDLWSRAALKAQPSGVVHHNLIEALAFYANGDHLLLADPDAWDTCSGEPINFLHDDAGTASVEDGSIAKAAMDSLNSSPVSAGGVGERAVPISSSLADYYRAAIAQSYPPIQAVIHELETVREWVISRKGQQEFLKNTGQKHTLIEKCEVVSELDHAINKARAALSAPSHGGGVAHTDCRSEDGITVGLIDSIITSCRVLSSRDLTCEAVVEALRDLRSDSDVSLIKPSHGEQVRVILPPSPYMPGVEPEQMTDYERGEAQGRCDMWAEVIRLNAQAVSPSNRSHSAPKKLADGKVAVSGEALRTVLNALVNAPHVIRELQATREPVELFCDNPINVLVAEFNAAIDMVEEK